MKLKFLSLICALGLLAFGTSVMAQDAKVDAPTMPTEEMKGDKKAAAKTRDAALLTGAMTVGDTPNPNFCGDQNPYCNANSPQYNSLKCDAICAAYTKAHDFIVGQLCSDTAVAPATTKSTSCKTLCGGKGATLNDLSCCLTQVGGNLSMTTKAKLYTICNASFGTADCPFAPIANYAGWLCCPRESTDIVNCLKSANQTPPWTCATTFAPQKCPALPK